MRNFDISPLTMDDYQSERDRADAAERELERIQAFDYRSEVLRNCPNFDQDTLEHKLTLGGLGVAGEAGEVADLVKKINFHGVPLGQVREKLIKEMGDVHWYLEYLAAALGIDTREVLDANVAKLRARHPNGWTPESQQAKADER